jgi:hypothetical protein
MDAANDSAHADVAPGRAAEFACARCGARAMRVVVTSGDDPPGTDGRVRAAGAGVRVECGTFDLWTAVSEVGDDGAELHRVSRELVPFYCPPCAVSYCSAHWETWDEYDTDYPGGWYEGTRGRCPEGHVRLITD